MSKRAGGFKSDEKKKKAKTYHISKVSNVTSAKISNFPVSFKPYVVIQEKSPRKGGFCIETNVAGVMVMCARKKEDRAVREIMDIFNEV